MSSKETSKMGVFIDSLKLPQQVNRSTPAKLWHRSLLAVKMKPDVWNRLINEWREVQAKLLGNSKAISLKTNTGDALAGDRMTWMHFERGVSIINADGRFKRVTVTIEYEEFDGDVIVCKEDIYNASSTRAMTPVGHAKYTTLTPGGKAVPGNAYLIDGFSSKVNGKVLRFNGVTPLTVPAGTFDTLTVVGNYVLDANSYPSNLWAGVR